MMEIRIEHKNHTNAAYKAYRLHRQLHDPLIGLCRQMNTVRRGKFDETMYTIGGDLTGVHRLIHRDEPKRGSYHIGGSGYFYNEALIRTLGESVERYAQLVGYLNYHNQALFCSYENLKLEQRIPPDQFIFFTAEQLSKRYFPFQAFSEKSLLNWVTGREVETKRHVYLPAQLIFVGYNIHSSQNEPWINAAVTTGTAVHSDEQLAKAGALLELIQLDTAMGFWYSRQQAKRLVLDSSVSALVGLLNKTHHCDGPHVDFYYLENPDMPGKMIACVFRNEKQLPRVAIGLGADLTLESALYKAYIEATGVYHLAKIQLLNAKKFSVAIHPDEIYNLDDNVCWYAKGNHADYIDYKFPLLEHPLNAGDMAHQSCSFDDLLFAFSRTRKKLYEFDLNLVESKQLDLKVARYYSPDLLTLNLPSTPTLAHKRYMAYGGANYVVPHPFP